MANINKIVITGTHQSPALELIRALKNDTTFKWEIYYLGRKYRSLNSQVIATEYELFQKLGVRYFVVNSGKFDRNSLLSSLKGIPTTILGVFVAWKILHQIKPSLIVSFGGYTSIPVLYAGWLQGIKSIIHEQTMTNSLTTKLAAPVVSKIALSFDNPLQKQTLPKAKTQTTGNLLRSDLFKPSNKSSILKKIHNHKPLIYITGGNQGSVALNKIILSILPELLNKYNIIHQVGKLDFGHVSVATKGQPNYQCFEYIETKEVVPIYQNAKVIISRSGANITQELVALSKNSILIPLPNSQQDEQLKNATWAKQIMSQHVEIIDENSLTGDKLIETIERLSMLPNLKHETSFSSSGTTAFLTLVHSLLKN